MKAHRLKNLAYMALTIACLCPGGASGSVPELIGHAYGFIDRTGQVIVPPACNRAFSGYRGDWASVERDGKQGFVNLRTRQFTGLIFQRGDVYFFREPLFSLGPEPVMQDGKYGYVDQAGRTIIPFRYELARQFDDHGLAVVKIDGRFGFIDRRGEFAIPPQFEHEPEFNSGGLASVSLGGLWGVIDRRGRLVVPAKFNLIDLRVRSDLIIVGADGRRGAVDAQGRIVVPMKFSGLRSFGQNGLAAASLDADPSRLSSPGGHWGFIDRHGEFVIPPVYNRVSDFEDEQHRKDLAFFSFRAPVGLAEATSIDASGIESTTYIDARGKAVISLPAGISGIHTFRNGVIEVFDQRKHEGVALSATSGIFDPAKPASPTIWFKLVGDFGDSDLAPVWLNSGWGYADRTGSLVIEPQFASASAFTADGLASVLAKDPATGRYTAAFIDRTGKVKLQTPFNEVSSFGPSGFAQVIVNRKPLDPIELDASQCAPRSP